jgi:hypothetical protein
VQKTTSDATDPAASEESRAAIGQNGKVVANINIIIDRVAKEVLRFRV